MQKARWTILAMLAALVVAILALGGAALAQQEGTTVFPSATAQTEGSDQQLRVEKPGSGKPSGPRPQPNGSKEVEEKLPMLRPKGQTPKPSAAGRASATRG